MLGLAVAASIPAPRAPAWGRDGHQLITDAAIDNLPAEMFSDGSGNAFSDWRGFLVAHGSHADGLKRHDALERHRHWIDMDTDGVFSFPFDDFPRDIETYLTHFDRSNGVNAWEGVDEHFDGLVQAFRARNWHAVYRVAADLAHYIEDCTSPFHSTVNFDGQVTGNDGIHARHESELVQRHITFADLTTRRSDPPLTEDLRQVDDPVEFALEALIQGYSHLDAILAADDAATALDPGHGDLYYQQMNGAVGALTVDQLSDGAQRLADLWHSAWVEAGSPPFDNGPVPLAAPVVDGPVDGDLNEFTGGGVLQTNTTDLQDNENELNQLFIGRGGGELRIGVAGNISPGRAVTLLLDTETGGSHDVAITAGPAYLQELSGLMVTPSLRPDHIISLEVTETEILVHAVDLQAGTAQEIDGSAALNNSNTGGVRSRDGRTVTDAGNVRTGAEISVPFETLGISAPAGTQIGVMALLTNASLPVVISNQLLPGLPLGEFVPSHPFAACEVADVGHAVFELAPASDPQFVSGLAVN